MSKGSYHMLLNDASTLTVRVQKIGSDGAPCAQEASTSWDITKRTVCSINACIFFSNKLSYL